MAPLTFIIGGAARSGTTFLATALDRHPGLWMLKPYAPEPKIFIIDPDKTPAEYLAEIARWTSQAPPGKIIGEKTSYYFPSEDAVRRIRATLPAVKMIFIVREPVARAYSNYLWSRKNGLETLSFDEACATEATRPDPMPPEKAYVRPHDYLNRGRYGTYAQRWINAVGRNRVLFLLCENLDVAPERLFERIQDFLGVARHPLHQSGLGHLNISVPNAVPPPAMAAKLKHIFADEVALFAKLTGEDLSLWRY